MWNEICNAICNDVCNEICNEMWNEICNWIWNKICSEICNEICNELWNEICCEICAFRDEDTPDKDVEGALGQPDLLAGHIGPELLCPGHWPADAAEQLHQDVAPPLPARPAVLDLAAFGDGELAEALLRHGLLGLHGLLAGRLEEGLVVEGVVQLFALVAAGLAEGNHKNGM